jgi:hypothetical protein
MSGIMCGGAFPRDHCTCTAAVPNPELPACAQVLLDRYGPAARTVAKELNRKGYNKVFVIQGGFDGRSGWVQSKLQIKPAANLSTAIAPPQVRGLLVVLT